MSKKARLVKCSNLLTNNVQIYVIYHFVKFLITKALETSLYNIVKTFIVWTSSTLFVQSSVTHNDGHLTICNEAHPDPSVDEILTLALSSCVSKTTTAILQRTWIIYATVNKLIFIPN